MICEYVDGTRFLVWYRRLLHRSCWILLLCLSDQWFLFQLVDNSSAPISINIWSNHSKWKFEKVRIIKNMRKLACFYNERRLYCTQRGEFRFTPLAIGANNFKNIFGIISYIFRLRLDPVNQTFWLLHYNGCGQVQ